MMRVTQKGTPLGTGSGNAMPPYEKSNARSRGTLPALKASTTKALNKAPLTPRIAGSAVSTALSPLARKGVWHDGNISPTSSRKEDFPTPVATFLSSNITPRSSSRKTRVDSANSTPTHTPIGTPALDALRSAHDSSAAGLSLVAFEYSPLKRSSVSFDSAAHESANGKEQPQYGLDKRFFYASDAKVAIQQPKQQPLAPESKTPSFIYANGNTIPAPLESSRSVTGSVVSSAISENRSQPKFFHANGTPDSSLEPVQPYTVTTSSAVYPQVKANKLVAHRPGGTPSPSQVASPPITGQDVPASTFRYASPLPSPEFPQIQNVAPSKKIEGQTPGRRTSCHEKSASTGALDMSPSSQWALHDKAGRAPLPSLSTGVFTPGSVKSPEVISSELWSGGSAKSDISSPIKTGHLVERMNELAADARRERKVLDLEITNSSLEAINRTLEREMRKQTAELRRYRRLSRSGRLSIITPASMRMSSETHSSMDATDAMPLSNIVEESDIDEEQTSDEESTDEGSLSPEAMAENDARHRMKDEKRLQLDLSKHQQLLIDSQNMNQSLKRCLSWTEELIREGKRALEYNVHVSDIEFGGRVLPPDELDDNEHNDVLCVVRKQAEAINNTAVLAGSGKADVLESESILYHREERQHIISEELPG